MLTPNETQLRLENQRLRAELAEANKKIGQLNDGIKTLDDRFRVAREAMIELLEQIIPFCKLSDRPQIREWQQELRESL